MWVGALRARRTTCRRTGRSRAACAGVGVEAGLGDGQGEKNLVVMVTMWQEVANGVGGEEGAWL